MTNVGFRIVPNRVSCQAFSPLKIMVYTKGISNSLESLVDHVMLMMGERENFRSSKVILRTINLLHPLSFLILHLSACSLVLWPSGSLFHLYKIIPWWIGFGTQPKSSHQINFVAWLRKCDRSWTITKNFYW